MPKSFYDIPLDKVDWAGDITEFAINSALGQSQPTQTVEDCYNEVGGARGYADGFATVDFGINGVAGPIAAPSPWDAIPACDAFGKPPADDGINIPSLTNPVWAALEVALTPTTLGDATPPSVSPTESGAYSSGYDAGFQSGALDAFNSNLDARFESSFQPPEPHFQPAITDPVSALDYTPPSPSSSNDANWHVPSYHESSHSGSSSGYDGGGSNPSHDSSSSGSSSSD